MAYVGGGLVLAGWSKGRESESVSLIMCLKDAIIVGIKFSKLPPFRLSWQLSC